MRRALAARRGRSPRACALRAEADRSAQQLLGQTRGLRLSFLRHGRGSERLCRAGSSRAARGRGVDRSDDRRALERGDARRRWLRHSDLRRAAGRARARLCAPRDWPWAIAGTPQGRGAHSRRRRRASLDRRRKRPLRHGGDELAWAARLHQVGRGGRILRCAARTRAWPCGQGGRWGRARGASDDCRAHPALRRFRRRGEARVSRFVSPRLSNWNGAEVGLLRPAGPLA